MSVASASDWGSVTIKNPTYELLTSYVVRRTFVNVCAKGMSLERYLAPSGVVKELLTAKTFPSINLFSCYENYNFSHNLLELTIL